MHEYLSGASRFDALESQKDLFWIFFLFFFLLHISSTSILFTTARDHVMIVSAVPPLQYIFCVAPCMHACSVEQEYSVLHCIGVVNHLRYKYVSMHTSFDETTPSTATPQYGCHSVNVDVMD
jgi:hypothetical protein